MEINLPNVNVNVGTGEEGAGAQIGAQVGAPEGGEGTIEIEIQKSPNSISTPG